ncbi:hypothetical protein K1719_020868 [Acacia pycnantha]|nr:hypothetical protein K1719_020868 [Acacia pycnantha]
MIEGISSLNQKSGPFITTGYDYDAPIDEYGLPRLPKWGHLKELHRAIKLCEANVYTDSSGGCAAFIANIDDKTDKTDEFGNASYHLPAWSVSILPDCKKVVFDTEKNPFLKREKRNTDVQHATK